LDKAPIIIANKVVTKNDNKKPKKLNKICIIVIIRFSKVNIGKIKKNLSLKYESS